MSQEKKLIKRYKYGNYGEMEIETYDDGSVLLTNTCTGVTREFDKEHSQEAFGIARMNAQRYNILSRALG